MVRLKGKSKLISPVQSAGKSPIGSFKIGRRTKSKKLQSIMGR